MRLAADFHWEGHDLAKQQKPRSEKSKKKSGGRIGARIGFALLTLFLVALTTGAICCCALAYYVNSYIKPEAQLDIANLSMKFNSEIYYTNSYGKTKLLQTLKSEEDREWVSMESIPEELKQAFVAIEDKRFYEHSGVDWKRTFGAAVNWILPTSSSYGGSTITQQLIKNMTSDDDYSVKRKLTEIVRAMTLEEQLDKDTILELYMNIIYFGENSYGVQTASRNYFGKSVNKLDLAECAMLAGLTQNPAANDPYKHPDTAKERQEAVLGQMYEQGYISESEYEEAVSEELTYKRKSKKTKEGSVYSYFTDTVIRDVVSDLQEEKGFSQEYAQALVSNGGLQIYSTMDLQVQKTLENVYENDANFPTVYDDDGVPLQSAMAVLDPTNGNLLGIVGGRGEKTESLVLNRATQTTRAPGSSIKPLSTYAPAIDAGLITPYSVVTDMPVIEYNDSAWPKNENLRYKGQTTIMDGVAQSTNTVAVQVMKMLTTDSSIDFLTQSLGFTTLDEESDNGYAPLALGGLTNGVTVRQMAQAYTALANYGEYSECNSYTKVLDANGNVLLDHEDDEPVQVLKKSTAYYMNDLLTNVVENGTGTLAQIEGIDVAGKTGTTTDDKDRWFAGYTPYYVGVCWVGFDSGDGLPDLSPNPAVQVWSTVMNRLHEDKDSKSFKTSSKFVTAEYCMDSGMAPTDACRSDPRGSRVRTGSFSPSDVPTEECTMHTWSYGVGLLDLTRLFPISVTVEDEYYCIRGDNPAVGEGEQVSSSGGSYVSWAKQEAERKAAEEAAAKEEAKKEAEEKEAEAEDGENPNNESEED
jgi:penicillin-binding protein 1A